MLAVIDLDRVIELLENADRKHCLWVKKEDAIRIIEENAAPVLIDKKGKYRKNDDKIYYA